MKKFLIYYFFFLFFTLSFFASGAIDSQDGFQYLAVARNIYYKHEPTAPVYEYEKEKNIHMSTYVGKDGKTYSPTGLGFSLAYVPAVAITDLVYKIYDVPSPVHFPLESDWLILMLASFTNVFFAAGLGVVMYVYFLLLKLSKKQAVLLSLITLFATNLFVYAKHSVAHMMFITFLMLSFLSLKLYSLKKKNLYLVFSGVAFGVVIITYNMTFALTIPAFALYYLLLQKDRKLNTIFVKKTVKNAFLVLLGAFPFIVLFLWFEFVRQHADLHNFLVAARQDTVYKFFNVPLSVFIEGIYGQLLSPGRSIFLYSPVLLVPILFWHKLKKNIRPELIAFLALIFIYIPFYAMQFSTGRSFKDQGYAGLWHGEASWGPRYLTPLIPFGMFLVGIIYQSLSKNAKRFGFFPLIVIGVYIQFLGVLMPYQIKFQDLDHRFYANNNEYTVFTYSNLLPRYSPLFMMSKKLVKLVVNFPKTLNKGLYNFSFYDGLDFPFNLGGEDRWRVIEGKGYARFDNNKADPIRTFTFNMVNHPLKKEASPSALVNFILNDKKLLTDDAEIKLGERKSILIPIPKEYLKDKDNEVVLVTNFADPNIARYKIQFVALISLLINDKEVNKEFITGPFISSLGPKMTGVTYRNWGGENKNLWKAWDIHTQIYERTPDFWWIKSLYYWDFPKQLFAILFIINISGILFFGFRTSRLFKKTKMELL